jgi:hypothetical protein
VAAAGRPRRQNRSQAGDQVVEPGQGPGADMQLTEVQPMQRSTRQRPAKLAEVQRDTERPRGEFLDARAPGSTEFRHAIALSAPS